GHPHRVPRAAAGGAAGAGAGASGGDVVMNALETTARPRPADAEAARVWDAAAGVLDPEVPVLTIEDLGVLRSAELVDGRAHVTLTPTYSGCPAMDAIRVDVAAALAEAGYPDAEVELVLSPAWTTDW